MSEDKYSEAKDYHEYQKDQPCQYINYGGMEFKAMADAGQINHFVANLPPEKKVSVFSVVDQLQEQGLIEVDPGSLGTADEDMVPYME